jgi:hypothetical protein
VLVACVGLSSALVRCPMRGRIYEPTYLANTLSYRLSPMTRFAPNLELTFAAIV